MSGQKITVQLSRPISTSALSRESFFMTFSQSGDAAEDAMDVVSRLRDIDSVLYHDHGGKFNRCLVGLKFNRNGRTAQEVWRTVGRQLATLPYVERVTVAN